MRHSDRRLTDQVYLDTSLLPLQECMRLIEGFGPLTQILTHFSGKDRQMLTQIVKRWGQSQRRVEEGGFEGGGVGEPLTGG